MLFEAEIEALRAENAQLIGEIEHLTRNITELEQRLSRGSQNSSPPPSSDWAKQQIEATKPSSDRRTEAKAKRKRGGTPPGQAA